MYKLFFSILFLSLTASEVKAESFFERAWDSVKTTAIHTKDTVMNLIYGPSEKTEPVHKEVTEPVATEANTQNHDQQAPEKELTHTQTTK